MILFVGQVAVGDKAREAFQEIDYKAMFGTVAKWAIEIDDASRVSEIVARAWHIALSGRPGPVVIALPEDMLIQLTDAPAVQPMSVPEPATDMQALAEAGKMLAEAKKQPLILVGVAIGRIVQNQPCRILQSAIISLCLLYFAIMMYLIIRIHVISEMPELEWQQALSAA